MKTRTLFVSSFILATFLAGCGDHSKSPDQQIAPAVSKEAANDQPPQDFVAVDKQPEVIKKVEPVYPELAKKAGLEGKVWVKIWIDTEGKPKEVVILKSDSEIFNQVTLDAAKQFLFKPAFNKDTPVAVWVSVPFKYALADKEVLKPETSTGAAEQSFMKGYIAGKEDALSSLEKEAEAAQMGAKPDMPLRLKIQKAKEELKALKDALKAMQHSK
jgi:TonB family protein